MTSLEDIKNIWDSVKNLMRENYSETTFSLWFENLEIVHFPKSLRQISACAFAGCKNLKSVDMNLPDAGRHNTHCHQLFIASVQFVGNDSAVLGKVMYPN